APPLRGPATVVGDRGDVADQCDLEAGGGQRAQRRFAPRARTLDQHAHVLEAVLHRLGGGVARCHLVGEGGGLARALEAARSRRRPAEHIPAHVGDGDDGVVERALDVDDPGLHVLPGLLLRLALGDGRAGGTGCGRSGSGGLLGFLFLRWLLLFGHVRWSLLGGGRGGDGAADDAALGSLAGAGVGVGALAADRQALAVAEAAVAAQVHQALDVERDLAAEVAFHLVALLERFADAVDLVFGEVLGPLGSVELRGRADLPRGGIADSVQV